MTANTTTVTSVGMKAPSSIELLFLRLCSALEAITIYIIAVQILPNVYKKIHRSTFYIRLGITYLLIILLLVIRFYDFLETNIFRSMSNEDKIRFLLYVIIPLESMFDMSLVCLSLETLLDLSSTYLQDKKLWIMYAVFVVALPASFLVLMMTVWETKHTFTGELAISICGSVFPAVSIGILLISLYMVCRRKKETLNDDQIFRSKLLITANLVDTFSAVSVLILYVCKADLIMDDLFDSLMKFGVTWSYLLVSPGGWTERYMLTSLNQQHNSASSINHRILREEQTSIGAN